MSRWCVLCGAMLLAASGAGAREFRPFRPIPTPRQEKEEGAVLLKTPVDLPKEELRKSVLDIIKSWNSSELLSKLDKTFYDGRRLQDSIHQKVPRDAELRVLGIRNIQILQQYITPATADSEEKLTSMVSVTLQTQIEFRDPTEGFQRIEGENEFILHVEAKRGG